MQLHGPLDQSGLIVKDLGVQGAVWVHHEQDVPADVPTVVDTHELGRTGQRLREPQHHPLYRPAMVAFHEIREEAMQR